MTVSRVPATGGGTISKEVYLVQRGQERSAGQARFAQSTVDQILEALGSPLVCQSWDSSQAVNNVDWAANLVDARVQLVAMMLREPFIATGMVHYMVTAGVFTADNNNKVGLYRIADNGTDFEQIGVSATDPTGLFKTTGFVQKPFAGGTLALESGLYFGAVLANWSAVTTTPQMLSLTALSGVGNPLLTGLPQRAGALTAQTNLNTPIAISSVPATTGVPWMGIY